jgi:hypothetical protein
LIFFKINKNWTVGKDLNYYIIVAAIMNEFSKRSSSRASISKQTKQHILKAFNKIKDFTHGDNGNWKRNEKVQNCRSK